MTDIYLLLWLIVNLFGGGVFDDLVCVNNAWQHLYSRFFSSRQMNLPRVVSRRVMYVMMQYEKEGSPIKKKTGWPRGRDTDSTSTVQYKKPTDEESDVCTTAKVKGQALIG
jgi:hypothetical protein